MQEFRDSEGRRWTLRLTLGDVKRVMEELGVNLLNLSQFADSSEGSVTMRLINDDLFVAEIVAIMLKEQADGYAVKDVLGQFDGATMKRAQDAFLAEFAFFFQGTPERVRRGVRRRSSKGERSDWSWSDVVRLAGRAGLANFQEFALYELLEYYRGRMASEWDAHSTLCALIANCHSSKKRFKPRDFNPLMRQNKPELTADQAREWLKKKMNYANS